MNRLLDWIATTTNAVAAAASQEMVEIFGSERRRAITHVNVKPTERASFALGAGQ